MRVRVHQLHHQRVRGWTACWEAARQSCVSHSLPPAARRASDKCQREKRKTINGDDLLWAMTTLGFDAYVEPLRGALLASGADTHVERHCPARC